jgi:hypothetical protein
MANRRSFLAALWDGDLVGAAGALVAGILHMIVMGLVLLVLTAISPLLAVILPFVAYHLDAESLGIFALFYFALGGFVSATITGIVYCHVTRKDRRAAGVTFGRHCRTVAGWPTLSIICSWTTSAGYTLMFRDSLLWSDSNMAHAIFFALAPVAVFSPLWFYLVHRRRQTNAKEKSKKQWREFSAAWDAAREEEETAWQKMQDDDRQEKDAAFLHSQGIAN